MRLLIWTVTRVGRHGRCIVGATVGVDGDASDQIKELNILIDT